MVPLLLVHKVVGTPGSRALASRAERRGPGYAQRVDGAGSPGPARDDLARGHADSVVGAGGAAVVAGLPATSIPATSIPATSSSHEGAGRTTWGWWGSTTIVALGAYAMGLVALWQAAYITHATVAATADKWDGAWYYEISRLGYVSALPRPGGAYAALRPAFFPGLPLVEHVTHAVVGGPPARSILLLGAIALVASCLLFRALVARMFDEAAAWRATILFAFFPGGYVFIYGYSELLEIPLALLVLYAIRRRWYVLAGVATLAATGTRLLGVALVVALMIAAVREVLAGPAGSAQERRHVAAALASPLVGAAGLVGYMVFLKERTGRFLTFVTAERVGWRNTVDVAAPYHALLAFFAHPLGPPWTTVDGIGVIVVGVSIVYLAVGGRRWLRLEELAYAVLVLLAWLCTSNTGAWFRFVLAAFPLIALVGARLDGRYVPALACLGAALLGILVVLFGTPAFTFAP